MEAESQIRHSVTPSEGIDFGVRSVGRQKFSESDAKDLKYFNQERSVEFLGVYWLLQGSLRFMLEGDEKLLRPGDVLIVLPGSAWTQMPPTEDGDIFFFTMDGPAIDQIVRKLRFWNDAFHVGPPPVGRIEALFTKVSDGRSVEMECDAAMIGYELLSLISKKRRLTALDPLVEQIQEVVHSEWSDPDLTLDIIAREVGSHKSTICNRFKAAIGMTLWQYVTQIRLRRAKDLIENLPNTPISEIAMQCGFNHASHFCRVFRDHFGKSASDVRHNR